MRHKYWKFGICLIALFSILSAYAQPLCCGRSFCPNGPPVFKLKEATVLNNLPHFNAIHCEGSLDVQIFGGSKAQQVVFSNPHALKAEVKNGILYLSEGTRPFAQGRLLVTVYMDRDLNRLSLAKEARVFGECIQSRCLTIFDESCGDLCLRGHIVLDKLISTGSGNVDIEWVDNNAVEVIAVNTAHIRLAGRATQLYAKLTGTAKLDAKYLQVQSAWIKASGGAVAEASSSTSLNTFASDLANVNYYKEPKSFYINTQDSATSFYWWDNL